MAEKHYPEMLDELREELAAAMEEFDVPPTVARDVAWKVVEKTRKNWGGQLVYIPKGLEFELTQRDLEIYKRYNGANMTKLCRAYGVSSRRIYHILAAMHERSQGKLFEEKKEDSKPAPRKTGGARG